MAEYFTISSDLISDADRRLLSYSGVTKGGKLVLTLKVEVDGWHMGQSLASLERIHAVHNQKPAGKVEPAPSAALPGASNRRSVMVDTNDWPLNPDADPDCECCLGDGLQADGETPCPCLRPAGSRHGPAHYYRIGYAAGKSAAARPTLGKEAWLSESGQ